MKQIIKSLILLLFMVDAAYGQSGDFKVFTSDIDHFWTAYDRVRSTKDSAQQYAYLNRLFIDKSTPGQKAMMNVRNYTAKSYIDAINNYPLFWNSIRANTLKAGQFAGAIEANVLKLKQLYPALKPAEIYFTVGALRSGGTTMDNKVLIGSEIAMADEHTVTTELPKSAEHLKAHFKDSPIKDVVFTNVHEYVHTQQKTTIGNHLLAQTVLEGVAEFMAEQATGKPSRLPAIDYGKKHPDRIKEAFSTQLFNPSSSFWLYSNADNEFGMRYLGYYVGYAMCKNYYDRATNKKQAVKEMIELDYNNDTALSAFVDRSGYFAKPVSALKTAYEKSRPVATGIQPFRNNATGVDPSITQITIQFSAVMDKGHRNFELGPLGKDNLLTIKRLISFSEDGRSATFEVIMKPGQHYQVVAGDGFISKDSVPLIPYLINFTTAAK